MNFASLEEDLRRKLLLMRNPSTRMLMNSSVSIRTQPSTSKQIEGSTFPVHDWGVFGEYEYLGPGTPYTSKHRAGIKPKNRIDEIAMSHDRYYQETQDYPAGRSQVRGPVDFGAGSAMVNASVNPYNDLTWKDRILGFVAGSGLIIQGVARVHPVTTLPMGLLDYVVY